MHKPRACSTSFATKMVLPEDLERYRTIFELLNKTIPKTERATIERIAPATSTDSPILLLRGSLLAAIREDGEALKAFRRALDIDNVNADNWDALIRQFVRMGDLTSAKKALEQAEFKLLAICRCVPPQKTPLERAEMLITLGGCSELCGDIKTAGERLHEALRVAPKEVVANKRVVEYYLRTGRNKEADQLLEALAEDPAQDLARWARRFQAGYALMSSTEAYNNRGRALAHHRQEPGARPTTRRTSRRGRSSSPSIPPPARKGSRSSRTTGPRAT